jgi:hypothetical protein
VLRKHPLSGRQIRILKLKERSDGDVFTAAASNVQIVCNMEVISLPESPAAATMRYKALSWYCSDQEQWDSQIFVLPTFEAVQVPDPLRAALQDIGDLSQETAVWVYQVCIDHDSADEVAQQTSLVPDIFQHASEVIVWPGLADDESAKALSFVPDVVDLRNIDDLVLGSPNPIPTPIANLVPEYFGTPPVFGVGPRHNTPDRPRVFVTPKSMRHQNDDEVPEKWQSLVRFMIRPYFSRRWAFLEVALAQSATIYCGLKRIRWSDFCDAITLLGSRFEEVRLLLERAEAAGR